MPVAQSFLVLVVVDNDERQNCDDQPQPDQSHGGRERRVNYRGDHHQTDEAKRGGGHRGLPGP